MDFEKEIRQKVEAENFARNNGRIIRVVNILAGEWIDLSVVRAALENDMAGYDFDKSMIFLLKSGYLELRKRRSREKASWEDRRREDVEVALTGQGMKLAAYRITDEAVEV